jgi:hypothetical protein
LSARVQVALLDCRSPDAATGADTSRRRNETRVIAEATYTPVDAAASVSVVADADANRRR